MSKTKECPQCAMQIERKEKKCPICGHKFQQFSRTQQAIAILLLVLFVLLFILRP